MDAIQAVNFKVISKSDPTITSIITFSSHAVLYEFASSSSSNGAGESGWSQCPVEGPIFLYTSSASSSASWHSQQEQSNSENKSKLKHIKYFNISYILVDSNGQSLRLIILNRQSLANFIEILVPECEFQINSNFLIYKSVTCEGKVYGLWFFSSSELIAFHSE